MPDASSQVLPDNLHGPEHEVIMEHDRLYGNGLESMNWLPYINLMSKRPTAMKYTEFYQQLPDNWQKYLGKQNAEGKRKGLVSLYTIYVLANLPHFALW